MATAPSAGRSVRPVGQYGGGGRNNLPGSELSDNVTPTSTPSQGLRVVLMAYPTIIELRIVQRPVRDASYRKWNTCRLWTCLIYRVSLGVIARMKGTRSAARLERDLIAFTRYPA
jgi:hypothetical protein